MSLPTASGGGWMMIDFDNDPTTVYKSNLYPGAAATITSEGDGWYRMCLSTLKGSANGAVWVGVSDDLFNTLGRQFYEAYADGTHAVLVYGIQVEEASSLADATPGALVNTPDLYRAIGEVTSSSATTRAQDVMTLTDTGGFNVNNGTMVAGWAPYSAEDQTTAEVVTFSSNLDPTTEVTLVYNGSSEEATVEVFDGGVSGGSQTHTVVGYAGGDDTIRVGYFSITNDLTIAAMGEATITEDGIGNVPITNTIQVGKSGFDGHVSYLKYYPCRPETATFISDTEVA